MDSDDWTPRQLASKGLAKDGLNVHCLEDVPMPQPGPGEVLVRVRACGLRLTLVWNRNGRGGASGTLPRIIGHEVAGDVTEVGPYVDGFNPGDRVNVYDYLICGHCRWCDQGRDDLCEHQASVVGRQIDGGLAEYVKLPARNLCHLPPEISYVDTAVTADAIATPVHVVREHAQPKAPDTVLVVGAGGGVGIHMVQMAKVLGASQVIAVDITAEKLALAQQNSADSVINVLEVGFDEEALRLTKGHGVDIVVEMVGVTDTLERSLRSLGKGGRLVWVGTYDGQAMLPVTQEALRGECLLMGSRYCARHELAEAVELVARGRIRPAVTRLCQLEEADAVLWQRIEASSHLPEQVYWPCLHPPPAADGAEAGARGDHATALDEPSDHPHPLALTGGGERSYPNTEARAVYSKNKAHCLRRG